MAHFGLCHVSSAALGWPGLGHQTTLNHCQFVSVCPHSEFSPLTCKDKSSENLNQACVPCSYNAAGHTNQDCLHMHYTSLSCTVLHACSFLLQVWYVTLALSKVYAVAWIKHVKQLLAMVCNGIKSIKVQYTCTYVTWYSIQIQFMNIANLV